MPQTPSNMIPLGTKAPDFSLTDTLSNTRISLKDVQSDTATVVMFLCNHCPYVKHIQTKLVEVANIYQKKGIRFVAINSNNVQQYPADSPDRMRMEAETYQYTFPYLYDETQSVAKNYHAACTPDFYVFDSELRCVYRGRFDAATPGNQHPITGEDLTQALDCILSNKPISSEQKPSLGCNIKWK